jgi:O-antigen/teichoic acid export membrane protein
MPEQIPYRRLPSRRILREGVWVASGQGLSAIAALVSIRIMTELLAPEEFGRLTLLAGVVALALGLSATPRLQAVIRYYPEAAREGQIDALRILGFRLVSPVVAVTATILAGGGLMVGPRLGEPWFMGLLLAATLVIDSLRSFELVLFNAARRQRIAALIYIADAWSRPLMAIVAVVVFGSSAEAALAGYVAGSGAVVLAIYAWSRLEGRNPAALPRDVNLSHEALLTAAIRRYALPLMPLAVFGWLSGMGDRYVIADLLSLHDAGLYAAAYGLASRPFLMLGIIVELTMRPVLQNAAASRDEALVARTHKMWLLTAGAGAAFGVACFFLLSDWVGHLLLAGEFRSATALMPWIALGYSIYIMSNVFSRFCYAFDNTNAVLYLTVAGAVIGILVSIPAIAFGGLFGASVAVTVRFGIELTLSIPFARRARRRFFLRQPVNRDCE